MHIYIHIYTIYIYIYIYIHTHTYNIYIHTYIYVGFPGGSVVKNQPENTGNSGVVGMVPGLGRPPGGGNGNSLQYSCLENPKGREARQVTVDGVAKCHT